MPIWSRMTHRVGQLAIALPFVAAIALGACDRGGSDARDGRVGAGFLPTATQVPRVPGAIEGFFGWCPPLPRTACLQPGDTFNPHRDLSLDRVVQIEGHGYKEPFMYVLDRREVSEIMAFLDADVRVDVHRFGADSDEDRATQISLLFTWESGYGAFDDEWSRLDFRGDSRAGWVSYGFVQWQAPPEFFDRLARGMSEVSPTPEPSPTATPEIVPPGSVFFGHPDAEVEWDGPTPRVVSVMGGHCASPELEAEFAIPSLLMVEDRMAFWATGATRRDRAWRWTGYSFEQWEIWQGNDPSTVYIVSEADQRIAFEYRRVGCI